MFAVNGPSGPTQRNERRVKSERQRKEEEEAKHRAEEKKRERFFSERRAQSATSNPGSSTATLYCQLQHRDKYS
ncbi:hypothetical protein BBJ28_00009486 [Nothophytophthora sp. Chile5]|nr:hypothetical protein BBJ28_00009486 [Nothophytophthora sp. Chile5]